MEHSGAQPPFERLPGQFSGKMLDIVLQNGFMQSSD
jgi:hypothetical protein